MRRILGSVLLTGFLCVPVAMLAQDEHRESRDRAETQRYYDPYQKQYHEWNDTEQRAWEHWNREVRHRDNREFAKATKKEQRDYWKWRHGNPDWDRH